MSVRVYVGNLPFKTTDEELKKLFEGYGKVESANVIRYKGSGRSKGYAFVLMNEDEAQNAIEALNENEYEGRVLKVRIAKPRENYPQKADQKDRTKVDNVRIGLD